MEKIKQEEFERLVDYMRDHYGVNLEKKKALVEGRLWSVINQKGFDSLDGYLRHVAADASGAEAGTLVTRLTTNYTYFMREDQHYKFLAEQALPPLIAGLRDKDLRIWSAGCSSGEEPYTIAMVIDALLGPAKTAWDAGILATDISPQMLRRANNAIYGEEQVKLLPPEWIGKYFIREGPDQYRVTEAIRREVTLRPFNLMRKDLPFKKKFHIIFCRNVMIYFDKPTRNALVSRFYDALAPGGYFFIGMSETLTKGETPFHVVQPSIYQK